jgi:hypothetical protein
VYREASQPSKMGILGGEAKMCPRQSASAKDTDDGADQK